MKVDLLICSMVYLSYNVVLSDMYVCVCVCVC